MQKRILLAFLCLTFVLPARSVGAQKRQVTICQFAQVFVYLPLYVAIEKGFFDQEGIQVKLINGGGDDKTFAAVASGQAQFGVADPTFAAIAREKGQPGVVLASIVSGAPFWGVTKKAEIGRIAKAGDLRDLRIATYTAPSTNYTLMSKTLKDHEREVGNARIVQGAFGTLLPMLDAGAADVAMELEPVVSTAVKQGAQVVYSYPEMYGAFLLTGLYTTESYRDSNGETVQGVVNALERAVRYAHSDPDGTVAIAQKVFPEVDPEVVGTAVERMLREETIPEHVLVDPEGWHNAVQLRLEVGDLKSKLIADQTVDNTFAQRAVERMRAGK